MNESCVLCGNVVDRWHGPIVRAGDDWHCINHSDCVSRQLLRLRAQRRAGARERVTVSIDDLRSRPAEIAEQALTKEVEIVVDSDTRIYLARDGADPAERGRPKGVAGKRRKKP